MISLRVDEEMEKSLQQIAEELGLSKSEVIRMSLIQFIANHQKGRDAYSLGMDLFGKYSRSKQISTSPKSMSLKQKVSEKIHSKKGRK